jgi:MoxR-like ATPase
MYVPLDINRYRKLDAAGGLDASVHLFTDDELLAVNMALAARRPLLVRGEPGTGKSQFARAAATVLGRAFLPHVVDARTEVRDLLYTFDAVERLAVAQVLGAVLGGMVDRTHVEEHLAERRFVRPGPLWWAFAWPTAEEHCREIGRGAAVPHAPSGWRPEQGTVVLVDEIDKADVSVPNGLLDALGNGRFDVPGGEAVSMVGPVPLVVFTTNEERALPDAFLRRCVVLQLGLPEAPEALNTRLRELGAAHYPELRDEVLEEAARQLALDRRLCREAGASAPGLAEYLDLLRAVRELVQTSEAQLELLHRMGRFVLRKHPPETFV